LIGAVKSRQTETDANKEEVSTLNNIMVLDGKGQRSFHLLRQKRDRIFAFYRACLC